MIPEISDPKWRELVTGKNIYNFRSLGVKIMMNKVLLSVSKDTSSENIDQCIKEVHTFFEKNMDNKTDLQEIFGKE
jgi:Na+-transporting NADH:ubiquinone oxidoreductase subunit NqrC